LEYLGTEVEICSAEEDIWTEERWSDRGMEKTA
jgi:hypothetical protein